MKKLSFQPPPDLFVEIGAATLRAVLGGTPMELLLERDAGGRLTPDSKTKLAAALKAWLPAQNPPARALCALPARGVALRRLALPAGAREAFHQRLLLQIESEFPLPPDELAWGSRALGSVAAAKGAPAKQELLVAAVKKEVVADYAEIFSAAGIEPVFTLGALARNRLCPQPSAPHALLDLNGAHSELTAFENGVPAFTRVISAEGTTALPELAQTLKGGLPATKIFLSGGNVPETFPAQLAAALGAGWTCERLPLPAGETSAAIAGLKKIAAADGLPPLRLEIKPQAAAKRVTPPNLKKWAIRAGLLLAALLLLPYAEAWLFRAHLAKAVETYQAKAVRLATIDRELDFLQYLKQAQPPYLDALAVLAKAVPRGIRLDVLTMNSKGSVSLRAAFRDGQQVADFRAKLLESGAFAGVTIEEQTPTPDRQKVNVRVSAQWKPAAQWPPTAAGMPVTNSPPTNAANTNAPAPKGARASGVVEQASRLLKNHRHERLPASGVKLVLEPNNPQARRLCHYASVMNNQGKESA